MRIVSLCPSNTEMVCFLGLEKHLVGVDLYSDWPPEVVSVLPKLGPDLHIDVEKLRQLEPDLVLASLSVPGMERVVDQVVRTGLPTLVLNPGSLDDVMTDLERLAEAVRPHGLNPPAEAVKWQLKERIARVREAGTKASSRPRVYWEWWPRPLYSPGGDNWLTEITALAGGQNIFADVPEAKVCDPTGARVLEAAPDVILAVWTGIPQRKVRLERIVSRPAWGNLPAVQSGRVYALSEGLFCRPSPRLVDGLEQLLNILHPDLAHAFGVPLPDAPVIPFAGPSRDPQ